ncbi:uncharacterized protein LOC131185248 [Ahaetulla prasina]|uniref:uncharacterized protein LOC131185248 n=1 Tax=Ahaetulla prasina TaxID=499056 RepID=UPI0026490461|nr:uncharacterized protein LOC131185248 [Ahaetulla prasina]XP_058013592.1 uncharacterized protein LOC131185248 [Ahaetulla prasina]
MRSGYAALVLGSLMLQKDLSGGPSLRTRTAREADGKDGPVGFCPEGNLLSQFQHMLCSQGFCWISETTWGFPLAGAVLLLLWLGFEIWTSSCLARWQAQRRQPVATESHAAQPSSPLPEAACEKDFPATQAKHSSCICGKQLTPDSESYELPCQVHRHPYEPCQTPRSVCQDENLYQKYLPCPPPLLRTTLILPKHSSSSSSHSSSGSSSCLPLLKHLNLCCCMATDASWTMHDSLDASEASSSDSSSSESETLYFLKKKKQRGSSFIPLFPERFSEIKGAPLLPESHPEIKGVQQTSFAQINFVQSSTFEKEDHVILVEKSLEIRMGPLPAPTAPGSLPRLRIGDKEEAGEKPSPLSLLDQMAIQSLDLRVKEQKEEVAKTTEKSTPKPSSEKEEEPTPQKVAADPAGALPPNSEEVPTVLKGMDEKSRNFLEFHIKKKMVQRRCGVPTVVINSVNQFQSVKKKSFHRDLKKTMQNVLLIPRDVEAPAHPPLLPRNAMAIYMKSIQEPPRGKGYYVFHKANPEEIRKVGFPAPEKTLGLKPRDSQRSQRNDVLLSVEPEKLRKLLFHLTVKMVEIQKGAFPEMVEDSLCTFSILSVKPLPKLIRFGNKISRPKHLSLTFLAKEALCIIDFNISHKYMVFTWGIQTLHSKPPEKATPGLSKATQCPSSPEKGVPQKPPIPILVLKTPRKGASTPGGPESKQILLIPKPQGPRIAPLTPAEEPQDVQFTELFKQSCLAPSTSSKKAEGPPPQSLAMHLRGVSIQETEAPGEGIQPKKTAFAMPCPKSQGAADKGSPSTKQEAPGEKRTLKAANLQEELQDRLTDLPAPLKEGEKEDGKEAGNKKEGDQQGEPEGLLPYRALLPTFKKGAGAGSKKEADEQAKPYRAVPPSPEKGASKRDGDKRGELEGTMHYSSTTAGTGSKTGENQQAELEGSMHYRALPVPSAERGANKRYGDDCEELEGTIRYRAPSETSKKVATAGSQGDADRPAELEGSLRYASTGAGARSKKGRDAQAELEGTLHYRALPTSAEKGAREEHRPAELEGTMRCSALPQPAAEAGAVAVAVRAAAEGAGSAQRFPTRASKAGAQTDGKGAAGLKEVRTARKGRERAPRGEDLSLSVGLQAAGSQRDAPPTRASLFLRLHLTREKLHLHLQKRLEAALRPRQRAGLNLRVETGAGKRRGPPLPRPFCYACSAPERRGAAGRTVCWALPQRILDMSGGRVPQVARLERRPGEPRRGGPRRPARRRRGAGQARQGETAPGAIKPFA